MFQILDGEFASQVSHEVDGLIFQPVPDVRVSHFLLNAMLCVVSSQYLMCVFLTFS